MITLLESVQQSINQLGLIDKNKAWIFVIIKPGFEKYTQDVIEEFESDNDHKPWKLAATKTKVLLDSEAKRLYSIHKKEDFYTPLCKYMSSGPTTALIFVREGKPTKSMFKETGAIKDKIREKYGESDMRNVIHSSDSLDHMLKESAIYFNI